MEQQNIANGGLQYVPQIAVQYVYLDFDSELKNYSERTNVGEMDGGKLELVGSRIESIVTELNANYAVQNVVFVTEYPVDVEYSVIHIQPYINDFDVCKVESSLNFYAQSFEAFIKLNTKGSDETIIEALSTLTDKAMKISLFQKDSNIHTYTPYMPPKNNILESRIEANDMVTAPPGEDDDDDSFTVPIKIDESGNYTFTFVPNKEVLVRLKDADGNILVSAKSPHGIHYKGPMYRGEYTVEVIYSGSKPTCQKELKKGDIINIPTLLEDIELQPQAYKVAKILPDFSATIEQKPISASMQSISVAIESRDTIKVSGDVSLTVMGLSFSVNLSGDNALYIYTQSFERVSGYDIIVSATATLKNQDGRCNLFRIAGAGIKSVGLELNANTIENTYSIKGDIALRLAGGKACEFSCTIGAADGQWDTISIKGENLNKLVLPQYQIYIQTIGASAEDISKGATEATFGAELGLTLGPKIVFDKGCSLLGIKDNSTFSALSLDFSGQWKSTGILSGSVSVEALNGLISGAGNFEINDEGVSLAADVKIAIGGVTITGSASTSAEGLTIKCARTQDCSLFDGQFFKNKKLGEYSWNLSTAMSAEFFFSYDTSKTDSYISITGELGDNKLYYHYNLDIGLEHQATEKVILGNGGGSWAAGSQMSVNAPYSAEVFEITEEHSGKRVTFFIAYDGTENDPAWKLVDNKGNFYFNDFVSSYDHINMIKVDGGIEIIADSCSAGYWQLEVYGDKTTIGNCELTAYIDNTVAQKLDLRFTSRKTQKSSNSEDYTNWIYFETSVVTNYSDNEYYLYQDMDAVGYDGTLLGTVVLNSDGSFAVEAPVVQQAGGKYYYIVARNEKAFESYSNYSEQVVFEMTSADLEVSDLSISKNCYDESGEYCLSWSLTNIGTLTADTSTSNVFLSFDQNYDSGDILLSVDTVKSLMASEVYRDYCYFTLPEEYKNVPVYIGVYANAGENVNELGKDSNNLSWIEFNSDSVVDSSNLGQLMTKPTWNQKGIWNKYFPKQSSASSDRTIAGCGPVAIAQLLYSRKMLHSLSFTEADKYSYGAITLDSNSEALDYLSFEELNSRLSNIKYDYSEDEIAAFVFGIAIKLRAKFGVSATSVYTHEVLPALKELGFTNLTSYNSINDNIEGLIKRNLAVGLPVLVSLDGSVGHMVWLEDYDQITDRYYINFGWGGFCDTWYKLDDINADGDIYYIDGIFLDNAPEARIGIIDGDTDIVDNGIYTTSPVTGLKSVVDDIRVDLFWDDKGNDVAYCIEYADNERFENSTKVLTTNNFYHLSKLSVNGEYFWRVSVVKDDVQCSKFSQVNNFSINFGDENLYLEISDTKNSTIQTEKNIIITSTGWVDCDLTSHGYAVFSQRNISELNHYGTITISSADEADGIGGYLFAKGIIAGRIETIGMTYSNGMWAQNDLFIDEFTDTSVVSVKAETDNAIGLHAAYDIATDLNGIIVLWGKNQSYGIFTNNGAVDLTINGVIIALKQGSSVSMAAYEAEAEKLLADNKTHSTLLQSVIANEQTESGVLKGIAITAQNEKGNHIVFDSDSYIFGRVLLGTGNDHITVKTGAVLNHDIVAGGGNDIVIVEKGAKIYDVWFNKAGSPHLTISNGAIADDWLKEGYTYGLASDVDLSITLTLDSKESTVFFSGNTYDGNNNTVGMSIDAFDLTSTETGIYDILSGSGSFFCSEIAEKNYNVIYGTETFSLKAGETKTFDDGSSIKLYIDSPNNWDKTLKLKFDSKSGATPEIDDIAPTLSENITAQGIEHSVVLSWEAAVDNVGVEKYGYRYAKSQEELKTATVHYTTMLSNTLSGLEYGRYYWQITAFDAAGNQSKWSEIKSFTLVSSDAEKLSNPVVSPSTTVPTNQVVVLTAMFDKNAVIKEFSFDNVTWSAYTKSITVDENQVVWFRCGNGNGEYSDVVSYSVTNIDKVAPEKPTVEADVTAPTNGQVVVTATFSNDSVVKEYSLDGKEWQNYTVGIVCQKNITVYFRGKDEAGNYSNISSYAVTNIDKTAPEKPLVSADITQPTNGQVIVTATFSNDSVVKEYSLDGNEWQNYTAGIVCIENTTVYFRGKDSFGNYSDISYYSVSNIDKTAPEKPLVSADITQPTNGQVIVTATFSNDSVVKEYSLDGNEWQNYTAGIVCQKNITVYFRGKDEAGNYSNISSYAVTNIDKTAPEKPLVSADITQPTNGQVIVTATFSNDSVVKQFSLDGETWYSYTNGVTFSDNGIIYFRSQDAAGNFSLVASYEINNILAKETGVQLYSGNTLVSQSNIMQNVVLSSTGNDNIKISSGGIASKTTVNVNTWALVYSNGVTSETQINNVVSNGYLVGGEYVYSGGTTVKTIINNGGFQNIVGGYASATILNGGYQYVSSGGVAEKTVVNGGVMVIHEGGLAKSSIVSGGGSQIISSGGTAISTIISTEISGGDRENGVQIAKSGAVLYDLGIAGGGQETSSGAIVSGGYITSSGIQFVLGKTYDMQIYSGDQWITNTGIADRTTVYAGGEQSLISSGAKATNTTLKNGGMISIAAGASATGIIQEAGGVVARVQAHNAYVTGSNISGSFSCRNGVASNFILHDYMYLESGGSALDTTVSSGGFLWLRSEGNGGYASNVNIHSGGSMRVSSGTIAGTINLHRGGILVIDSCKSAANASVNLILGNSVNDLEMIYKSVYTSFSLNSVKDFFVTVSSAQTCGTYKLASGASDFGKTITVRSENKEIGTLAVGSNFTYNGLYYSLSVDSGMLNLNISNNKPAATNVTLFSSGTLVRKDEKIESAMLISGSCNSMFVSSGGTVEYTTIGNGGVLHILSNGNAQKTIIQSGGELNVSFGGNAQFVEMNAGRVSVQNGGTVDGLTLKSGTLNISSGAQVNNMQISAGLLYNSGIISGLNLYGDISINDGYIENLTVQSGGFAYFYGDYQTDINNATVKNLVIEKAGDVHLAKGVTLEGNVKIYGDLVVYDSINAANAEIDLFINPTDSNFSATISKLEKINGGKISVTVSSDMETGIYSIATGINTFDGIISVKNDLGKIIGNYSLQNGEATFRNGTQNLTFRPSFSATEGVASSLWLMVTYSEIAIDNIIVNSNRVSWEADTNGFVAELSTDNFSNVFSVKTEGCTISTYGMSTGNYQWRVQPDGSSEWTASESFAAAGNTLPQKFVASADDSTDVFFANAKGKWTSGYAAQHTGILNGWSGTNEQVTLTGKNKLADIFEGSSDANILVMTDDVNGDALFVDDIYTALPGTVAEQQARIAQIDEIRAGLGDDIVDLTSQRFAYVGNGVKIYGGLGNDTIWANNGNNALFGDAGNDRLVGGKDNDVIVGGIGNDSMHGGGGNDIFCFGGDFGNDTVEQLVGGEITLWFESGSENNWNADTLTYTDGTNSVKVSGVSADNITLIFGDDSSSLYDELTASGCFDDAASEKIFEDKNKGMLA